MSQLMGMDPDAVRGAASRLDGEAARLAGIIAAVDNNVSHAEQVWRGRDVEQFAGWWRSQHRPALLRAQESVAGLARSLVNNAADQDRTSGGSGAGLGAGASAVARHAWAPIAGGVAAGAASSLHQPASPASGSGNVGGTSGSLPSSGGVKAYNATAQFHRTSMPDYQGPPENGWLDQWGKAKFNCTSWAAFRRHQLGLWIPPGNGGAMGTDPKAAPTLGAVVSYGAGTEKDYGHVMIVEQVDGPGKIRVSEMNFDLKGGFRESQTWTKLADGTWKSSDGPIRQLKFTR